MMLCGPNCWVCDQSKIKEEKLPDPKMRTFETGATRSSDNGKPDYEGFLSPLALREFGMYMHQHRVQPDGSIRDSDNWQKGIPNDQLLKSLIRHIIDLWRMKRLNVPFLTDTEELKGRKEQLCAILFNSQALLHNILVTEERKHA